MKLIILCALLFIFSHFADAASKKVRRSYLAQDQIETVRTAVGIATIVQVPDRPNSVIVGDQDAFKVEYLDQAITIKPLHGAAKSNLYIYTEWRRYNVQLVTGSEQAADYVVYLESPKEAAREAKTSVRWTPIQRSISDDSFSLTVTKVGRTDDGLLLIDFVLSSTRPEEFRAEWLWLSQKQGTKPIHLMQLSKLSAEPGNPIHGLIHIVKSDIAVHETMKLELRRKKSSFLILPKVKTWR